MVIMHRVMLLIKMFSFIHILSSDDVKPSDDRRRDVIRRAAMTHVGRARRAKTDRGNRPKPRRPTCDLIEATPIVNSLPEICWSDPGTGRRDPFLRYPLPMSTRMHEIVQQSMCHILPTGPSYFSITYVKAISDGVLSLHGSPATLLWI